MRHDFIRVSPDDQYAKEAYRARWLQAFDADKPCRAASVPYAFQSLIGRAVVKFLPRRKRGKFQQHDSSRLPVSFVDVMRSATHEISRACFFQSRLHAIHEFLITRGFAYLDIEDHVRTHVISPMFFGLRRRCRLPQDHLTIVISTYWPFLGPPASATAARNQPDRHRDVICYRSRDQLGGLKSGS